jgi:hydroxyacylglutathione hydrolase
VFVKQFVDEGLGNSSYLVGSEETKLALTVDAQRDVDRYIQVAEGLGLRLAYAVDTHLHNDFVTGALELAAQVGLRVGASAEAQVAFEHIPLHEGDTLDLGDLTVGVLTTPGHTPEHISFTLTEAERQTPSAIFTGGALIVGGTARTDLLGQALAEPLARRLYHTIHDKLLHLRDDVAVYPTHGAGSFCAAPAVAERSTTIGRERQWNRLAQALSEQEFVAQATADLPSYPSYFQHLRRVNQAGPQVLGGVPVLAPISPEAIRRQMEQGIAVVDTRRPREFAAGHIRGSYGIPLDAPLITWVGWVVPFGTPLILIAEGPDEREQAVRQLIRIGYDDVRGYVEGDLAAWRAADLPVSQVPVLPADELARRLERTDAPIVLDVRFDAEWRAGHLPRAMHVEAGRLPAEALPLAPDSPVVVHCGHADRSTVGLSLLERRGYRNLMLLDGGFSRWQAAGYPVTQDVE